MGGAWQELSSPSLGVDGKGACSGKKCHLHLHGFTEMLDFAPVYSYRNAVGILMGSGNVGASLSFDRHETSTYMSRDGGLTWVEVKKGTWIYEYGNHGGLVVIADMANKTSKAEYSFDEGHSWHEFGIADQALDITNVLIEPDAIARKFIMYGHRGVTGILRLLDFSKLHQRVCEGTKEAGTDKSDYERWSPSDRLAGGECILGHKDEYVRRKQLAECFNEEGFEHPTFQSNCRCTKENYECDLGFVRKQGTLDCTRDPSQQLPWPKSCNPNGQAAASAYRRVPGDTCSGGFEPEQVRVPCHSPTTVVQVSQAQFKQTSASTQEVGGAEGGFSSTMWTWAGGVVLACGSVFLALNRGAVFSWLNRLDDSRTVGNKYTRPPPAFPSCGAEMVGNSAVGASARAYRPPLSV